MIIIEQMADGRTFTYSDNRKWIRQLETGNEYESAIDCVEYTYEETGRDIDTVEIDDSEALEILLGVRND